MPEDSRYNWQKIIYIEDFQNTQKEYVEDNRELSEVGSIREPLFSDLESLLGNKIVKMNSINSSTLEWMS